MRGIRAKAEKLGHLVIVGNGTVAHAQDFAKSYGKGLRSLVDSERRCYDALHFHRGIWRTVSPLATAATVRATAHGYIQGLTQGSATQMGGSLVVAAGGAPVFFQRSDFPGDHSSLETIMDALRHAAEAGAPT